MVFGKHINKYYLKYGIFLLIGIASLVAVDYLQLEIPKLYQMIVNGLNTGEVAIDGTVFAFDMEFLISRICFPMLFFVLMIMLGRFLWRIMFFGTGIRVESDLRNSMFDNVKNLSCEFFQKNKVGTLMSLFTNDLDTVQECFGWGIMMFFDALLLGIMAIVKMVRMDPTLTLLCMIPMAFLLASATIVGKYMMKKWDVRQQAFSKLSDFAQEKFSGLTVIKAFVKEAKELMSFKKINIENEEANVKHTQASVLMRLMVMLFVESVICVILGYGGYLVYQGKFNAGQLVEFIAYFTSVVWPIMAVSELIDMTSRGRASLKRISRLLEAKQDVTDREGAEEIKDVRGEIEFRDLTFSYPDEEYKALSGMTFRINAGENVGIVGRTGCGKTTVVDLLLRTYNVPDGTIFLDGHDVNSLTIHSVREACAYVPQDNFLFSDTIENNISFGVDEFGREDVVRYAKLADVHDNISGFAEGYDTILGERGVTVSGGQKQRISIARAMMRNAPILILDDSVSAVDTNTEKNILRSIEETRKGKTTILIAHRISTVEKMDKIIFIEDGTATAVGPHEELYATSANYRKMVDMQRLEEEGGAYNA